MSRSAPRAALTTATARLKQDYIRLIRDPVPYVAAAPLPHNILEWRYVVTGPENTPYEGGLYHGRLVFPRDFPFKPPSIYMITPNGRFKTNTRLCLSISDFHPDTWNPAWTVASILTGLVSFMVETTPTLGSVETTSATKRQLADASLRFNLADGTFRGLFPETTEYIKEKLGAQGEDDDDKNGRRRRNNNNNKNGTTPGTPDRLVGGEGEIEDKREAALAGGGAGGHLVNLCVFLGVAAFAFTVKCVMSTIAR